jgi:hypothetical protein
MGRGDVLPEWLSTADPDAGVVQSSIVVACDPIGRVSYIHEPYTSVY